MGINLLPPAAQNAKSRRRQLKIMAGLQVAVLVFIAFLIVAFSIWRNRLHEEEWQRTHIIASFNPAPAQAALELQEARDNLRSVESFFDDIIPPVFNNDGLVLLLSATPDGVTLTRAGYADGVFTVAATTGDMPLIEAHRANLAEIFDYVTVGRITTADGLFSYEITIQRGNI